MIIILFSRQGQSAAQAMDSNGIVYFGSMTPSAVYAWDSSLPYTNENFRVVARDRETLQFTSGVKIIHNTNGQEELWILTNKFQKRFAARYNWNEVNFRILARPINELFGSQSNIHGPGPAPYGFPGHVQPPFSGPPGSPFAGPHGAPFGPIGPHPTNYFPQRFGPDEAFDIFNKSVNNVLSQLGGGYGSPFPNFG
jgi:hypothetical protein